MNGKKMKIAVVTDSTSDIPANIATKNKISVVPLNLHVENKTYLDNIDISADELYEMLPSSSVAPTTSAPSAGTFIEVYENLLKSYDQIISIHISSKLSLTHGSAVNAAKEINKKKKLVEVINSETASMALGLTSIIVAETIKKNNISLDEAKELSKNLSERSTFLGMVPTLKYLVRGGRIGKAKGFVGSLLKFKPILTMQDGEAHPLVRVRSIEKGINKLKELAQENSPLEKISVLYTTEKDKAEEIAEDIKSFDKKIDPIIAQLGPVIGAHLGPNVLGLGYIKS
ncbi:MAG: fatty acid-binding protein DegV [Chloroflexi bacterium]|nr:fatty acid-binding protein DegV [Chloroflexota bacterium]|tara:strand:- start:9975 stop:10832 length:858 start_codon:yes stop_codon:yes gene_type:complete